MASQNTQDEKVVGYNLSPGKKKEKLLSLVLASYFLTYEIASKNVLCYCEFMWW